MARYDYDLIILGGGSAGIVSGVMAGGLKLRTLLIEKNKLGGECLNTGCVPSKALLHAASVAHTLRTAQLVGLKPYGLPRQEAAGALDYAREMVRVVREADDTEGLLRRYGAEIRIGDARFLDSHTLLMDSKKITSEYFLLATGSRPAVADIPGLQQAGYRTNQDIFDLREVPESLLVVGGGPVGVEMAQAFLRLGAHITLVTDSDRLLPREDAEISRALESLLRDEGMGIHLRSCVSRVEMREGKRIAVIEGTETWECACEEILLGIGRLPNVEGLSLERAGIAVGAHGILTDATLRTTAPNIYAAGDVQGEAPFSHMAEYEAKIAVRNILFPGASKADLRVVPWTTFTDPEVAHVGLTEEEATAQGIRYEVYRQPFAQDDRALVDRHGVGFVKIITQGIAGKVIGAHILGPRAGEIIQEWIPIAREGRSIRTVADAIHVYPTLMMASQHAAQHWYERRADQPLVERALKTYARAIRPRRRLLGVGLLGASLAGVGIGLAWTRRRKPRL